MIFKKERSEFLHMDGTITANDMHEKIKTLIYNEVTLKKAVEKIDYYSGPLRQEGEEILPAENLDRAQFECIITPGGSEGEYLDCILKCGQKQLRISCIKTLDESLDGYLALGLLAGAITKYGYEFLCINCI